MSGNGPNANSATTSPPCSASSKEHSDVSFRTMDTCLIGCRVVALMGQGLVLGLNLSIIGPTLIDLSILFNASLDELALVFVFKAICAIIGSFGAGYLIETYDPYLWGGIGLLITGLCNIAAPWMPNIIWFLIISGVGDSFLGISSVTAAMLCFYVWPGFANSLIQALRLLTNTGKVLAPAIAAPFLAFEDGNSQDTAFNQSDAVIDRDLCEDISFIDILEEPDFNYESHYKIMGAHLYTLEMNQTGTNTTITNNNTNVQFAYLIIGIIACSFSVLWFFLYICNKMNKNTMQYSEIDNPPIPHKKTDNTSSICSSKLSYHKCLTMLSLFLVLFLYGGMEMNYTGVLMTYTTVSLGWDKSRGLLLTTMFQFIKLGASAVAMVLVKCVDVGIIFLADCVITVLSTGTAAFMMGSSGCGLALWISIAVLALSFSNIYSTSYSCLEKKYTIKGKESAALAIAFTLGAMVIPPLASILLTRVGAAAFPYMSFALGIAFLFFGVVTYCLIYRSGPCCHSNVPSEEASEKEHLLAKDGPRQEKEATTCSHNQ